MCSQQLAHSHKRTQTVHCGAYQGTSASPPRCASTPLLCLAHCNVPLQIVYHTLREYDRDGDGGLNLQEFKALLSQHDLQQIMAVG